MPGITFSYMSAIKIFYEAKLSKANKISIKQFLEVALAHIYSLFIEVNNTSSKSSIILGLTVV